MIRLALALCLAAGPAPATPRFQDLSATLPRHVYSGGWEHFVGGGGAVFDCNGDTLPEIAAVGGTDPIALLINRGAMRFEPGPFPTIAGATGLYPIDIDGDDWLDLY
ncbi:MAG: VCBS repeat-containing protein, partial [Pararhodobacter sp.]|nr:VCBS repeat-containing protein [Pararhodobacter sp.]